MVLLCGYAEAEEKWETARNCFEKAIECESDLGEAHFALALWHRRHGRRPEIALQHLDKVTRLKGSKLDMIVVDGWRIDLLFRTGNCKQAFQIVHRLIGDASKYDWIWPWCARQVATFGKSDLLCARKALDFWRAYLREHRDDRAATRESLLCLWRLHHANKSTGVTFDKFRNAAIKLMGGNESETAFLWDRVGHWAQDEGNWDEAEKAYRKAYCSEPARYGYCLGTALNSLKRFDEALPILLDQAKEHQPDGFSWFHVAIAREGIDDVAGSIDAYRRVIELDPSYELAWFNLGGVYWNSRNYEEAVVTWTEAIARFPNHPLAHKLRSDFPFLFSKDTPA